MKNIHFLFLLLFIWSCNESSNKLEHQIAKPKVVTPIDYENKSYFNFDEVVHYEFALSNKEYDALDEKENNVKALERILITGICDTISISVVESKYFTKTQIDSSNFEALDEIFTFRKIDDKKEKVYSKCKPIYNDILIFRKNSKIAGIANVCFSCSKFRISGNDVPTSSFGQYGEYGKLSAILQKNQ